LSNSTCRSATASSDRRAVPQPGFRFGAWAASARPRQGLLRNASIGAIGQLFQNGQAVTLEALNEILSVVDTDVLVEHLADLRADGQIDESNEPIMAAPPALRSVRQRRSVGGRAPRIFSRRLGDQLETDLPIHCDVSAMCICTDQPRWQSQIPRPAVDTGTARPSTRSWRQQLA
jgi:hypothetical protein